MTNTITKITFDGDDYIVWPEYTAWDWIDITDNVISNIWVVVDSSSPASPYTWQLWYDTANSVLKIYDWATRQTI